MNRTKSSLEIIDDVLRPVGNTEITYLANMNYARLANSFDLLNNKGLVEHCPAIGRVLQFAATDNGKYLLAEIDSILRHLQIPRLVGGRGKAPASASQNANIA